MTHAETDQQPERDPHRRIAEEGLQTGQRAEALRREASNGQRSAADSFQRSAVAHERMAKTYEAVAPHNGWPEENRESAARHRGFSQEDRQIAQRLRQMADSDSTGYPAPPASRR